MADVAAPSRSRECYGGSLMPTHQASSSQPRRSHTTADMKARQSAKIQELGIALAAGGLFSLDDKAQALGLSRSTVWTILKGNHKSSGLSATIINRILAAPRLHPLVRAITLEYVEEKAAGLYGHSKEQRRKFVRQLSRVEKPSQLEPETRIVDIAA